MSMPPRLGRLHRVSQLGIGGFATVWLYRDDDLDSPVAVKALADNWAQQAEVRERFLEEARILRQADSDRVVRVYDIGETDEGTPYFVMTYADHGTLAGLLKRQPVGVDAAVRWVRQAGEGLAVLHRLGVIHRDVKPQNLLLRSTLDAQPELLVADLGVAKAMLHTSGIVTQVVGTPAYMAPEQAVPAGSIDERADVYALAAVAYRMLAGREVRPGGVGDLLQADVPDAPSAYAEVSADVDDVLLTALRPDRDQRWPDVESFVAALDAAAADESPEASAARAVRAPARPEAHTVLSRPAATAPVRRWRRRLATAGAGSAAVAALVLGYALVTTLTTEGSASDETEGSGEVAVSLPEGWVESSRTSTRVEYRKPDEKMFLRLDTRAKDASPRTVAEAELGERANARNFEQVFSREMGEAALGPWQEGWAIHYRYDVDSGASREMRAWYVGAGGATTGFVAISAPAGETGDHLALRAPGLEALAVDP